MTSKFLAAAAAMLLLSGIAGAAEIKVLASGAVREAYLDLVPQFEITSGHKVTRSPRRGQAPPTLRSGYQSEPALLRMADPQIRRLFENVPEATRATGDVAKSRSS